MSSKSPVWYLLGSIFAYFALWIGVPNARFIPAVLNHMDAVIRHAHQPMAIILSFIAIIILSVPTVAFMVAQISIVYYFAKLKMRLAGSLLCLIGALAALIAIGAWMMTHPDLRPNELHIISNMPLARRIGAIVATYHSGALKMLMYAVMLIITASIGNIISLRVTDKNLLLPVVMFAATIDLWTVTIGPVSSMMTHVPEIVKTVSAPIPLAGTGVFLPVTTMGPGDPLFIALVFAAVHRLGLNCRRNFGFVAVLMSAAMLAVMFGLVPYLPALVVLAIAVVAANWGRFKLTRQEKISTAIVGIVLLATLPLVWHALKPNDAPKKTHSKRQHNNIKHDRFGLHTSWNNQKVNSNLDIKHNSRQRRDK